MHNLFVTTNHDNSLLVLKMSFQVFSLVSKNIQLFSSGKKILMLLLSVLFYLSSQFFEILIFSQDIYRNILCLWNQTFPKELWQNLLSKTN